MSVITDEIAAHLIKLHQNHVYVRQEQLAAAKNMKAAAIATDQVIAKIEAGLRDLGVTLPSTKPTKTDNSHHSF